MGETETVVTVAEQVQTLAGTLDFSAFQSMYLTVAGIILPVAISVLAIKKGISWIKRGIKSV